MTSDSDIQTPKVSSLELLGGIFSAQQVKTTVHNNVLWIKPSRFTLVASPCSLPILTQKTQIDQLLGRTGGSIAQFSTTSQTGALCKNHILRDKSYSVRSLQRQFRQTLERGQKQLSIKHLAWSQVAEQAPDVIESTWQRVGRVEPINRQQWEQVCHDVSGNEEIEAIGCFQGPKMVGICICWRFAGGYRPIVYAVNPEVFSLGASNLLIFESLHYLIEKPQCSYVSFGRTGIPENHGVSRFKRHAGLVEEPIRVAALLHPRLRWVSRACRMLGVLQSLPTRLGTLRRFEDQIAGLCAVNATNPDVFEP